VVAFGGSVGGSNYFCAHIKIASTSWYLRMSDSFWLETYSVRSGDCTKYLNDLGKVTIHVASFIVCAHNEDALRTITTHE
jgi:hypothetical protein